MSNENKGLPLRDVSKPAEQQGMFRKFDVYRYDGEHREGGKHHGCRYFVLDLTHDEHAPAAMRAYAAACRTTHPLLADDIEAEHGPALNEVAILKACIAKHEKTIVRLHTELEAARAPSTAPYAWEMYDADAPNGIDASFIVKGEAPDTTKPDWQRHMWKVVPLFTASQTAQPSGLQPCQQAQCRYPMCACVSGGVCLPPGGKVLPDMNDDLRDILGRPNFTCISTAMRLRQMGHTIKPRAEEEQAAVIHLFLSHYLKHGAAWRDTVQHFLDGNPAADQSAPAAVAISSVPAPDQKAP